MTVPNKKNNFLQDFPTLLCYNTSQFSLRLLRAVKVLEDPGRFYRRDDLLDYPSSHSRQR
ncbi:MAG TPA: hypothetical protein VKV79_08325 [Terriglobia bacterium]|nr:hypothetical protein [Terriglobia bacterium]